MDRVSLKLKTTTSHSRGCGLPTIKGLKYTIAVMPNCMMAYAMDTHMSRRKFIPQNGGAAAHPPFQP